MSDATNNDDWIDDLRLTADETATLWAQKIAMMTTDITRETKPGPAAAKTTVLDAALTTMRADLTPHTADLTPRAAQVLAADEATTIGNLAPALAEQVTARSHAIVILAELMTFHPWTGKQTWTKNTRTHTLEIAATDLACLRPDDYATMTREFDALMKAVRRKNIKWGRVAVISAAGVGLGIATGGLAAPAIGGAVGGAMGLTGAAATSAGLAALGGGSIAAGGFGVAGGTLIISTAGGLLGAGLAATGAR